MAHPNVVHCKRARHDVYIGRPSKWGNPVQIGRDGTRAEVIALRALAARPARADRPVRRARGKTLGCWCAPNACHGDVLARLAAEHAAGR